MTSITAEQWPSLSERFAAARALGANGKPLAANGLHARHPDEWHPPVQSFTAIAAALRSDRFWPDLPNWQARGLDARRILLAHLTHGAELNDKAGPYKGSPSTSSPAPSKTTTPHPCSASPNAPTPNSPCAHSPSKQSPAPRPCPMAHRRRRHRMGRWITMGW
ncbi:MAG: hypothetical protein IPO95_04370 [Rhodanobacteraceae bacterium]|nr:hypothetical protein [Rhodanobacteraceae bacterium]